MASAIVGGLVAAGRPATSIVVVEPDAARSAELAARFGVIMLGHADVALAGARVVVWAVKPQRFGGAAAPCQAHVGAALQLSVMAGIRSDAIAAATGSERVVRAMPNTPALIGQGIAGLFARPAVGADERRLAEEILASTGEVVWVEHESALDAVTALSGSGPAYVFYLLEAMLAAGQDLGLPPADAKRLAVRTIAGAAALAAGSGETPEVLRRNVTSPGGTTQAAIAVLERSGVKAAFVAAMRAACERARELGDEFGASA